MVVKIPMSDIKVYKYNDVHMQISCDRGMANELYEFFSFKAPGFQFTPKYKAKVWDGSIHLFNRYTGNLYLGLHQYLDAFCEERDYSIEYVDEVNKEYNITEEQVSSIIEKYIPLSVLNKETDTWSKITPYDYQLFTVTEALRKRRALFLSSTSSGKSLILYLTCRLLLMMKISKRILIIVPRVDLVNQLSSDFLEYSHDDSNFDSSYIHKIYSGQDKNKKTEITFSTWQSLQSMDKDFLSQFDVCLIDEAHEVKAKSLTSINEKMVDCPVKLGFTGTIDDAEANKLVLEGLMGPVVKVITARELIKKGLAASMTINAMFLQYQNADKAYVKNLSYQDELRFIISHPERMKFLKNLALSLKGNTLILFDYVEDHGIPIYNTIKSHADKDRNIYLVHGDIKATDREFMRKKIEKDKDAIMVASFGTFSTGINIKNLHNIIFASSSKSMIRICQSLGRGLRISDTKSSVTVYDIIDDLSTGKEYNYIMNHGIERLSIYDKEKHPYNMIKLTINKSVM